MKEFDEKLISWFRYLFWADLCYKRFEKLLETSNKPEGIPTNLYIAFSSQWYGSLYVIIEGWEELNLEDKFINRLLNDHPNLKDLLRKYRNCVFHFQPRLLDNRIIDFVKTEDNIHLWIELLHHQFVRFFSEQLSNLPGDKIQKNEIQNALKQLIGWIPDDTINDKVRDLNKLIEKAEFLLKEGHDSSRNAMQLRSAIEEAKVLLIEANENYRHYLETSIKSIKRD